MSMFAHLPLPGGERIEVRGLGVRVQIRPPYPLTPLSFAESPSPRRGEVEVRA